jgi:hypothetical protein
MHEHFLTYDFAVNVARTKLFSSILSFIRGMDYTQTRFIIAANRFEVISLGTKIPQKIVSWPFDSIKSFVVKSDTKVKRTIAYIYDISNDMLNYLIGISLKSDSLQLKTNSKIENRNVISIIYDNQSVDFDCEEATMGSIDGESIDGESIGGIRVGTNQIQMSTNYFNEHIINLNEPVNFADQYVCKLRELNGVVPMLTAYEVADNFKTYVSREKRFNRLHYILDSNTYDTYLYIYSQNTDCSTIVQTEIENVVGVVNI